MKKTSTGSVLDEALSARDLAVCVDRYVPGKAVERHDALLRQLAKDRFVVPVYGVQGSGKSTLLNALAFDHPVLPVDVDETTCIPTEVVRAESPSAKARVVFKDGRKVEVPCDEDGLRQYVHQAENPGNELGVDRIIVGSVDPLLGNGLVLVDLPGLGSLTRANAETTDHYMQEATAVVFLLRAVPPLTRTESARLASVWARVPTAFFVQNAWSDESAEENKVALEHNRKVLCDLAEKLRLPSVASPEISIVNAYGAHRARLRGDAQEALSSGLSSLRAVLARASEDWPRLIRSNVREVLLRDLDAVLAELARLEEVLGSDREKATAGVERERQRFEEYFADLSKRQADASTTLRKYVADEIATLEAWSQSARQQLRNNMRSKMRAGIVDGPRLERSLGDEQTVFLDEVFCDFEERAFLVHDRVQQRFDGVALWKAVAPQTQQRVSVEEKTKYENVAPPVGGAVAVLGGVKLGAMVGALGGPIGSTIGGVIGGVLGALFGSWAGGKVVDGVTGHRADKVEPVVFRAIDQFCDATKGSLRKSADTLAASLDEVVRQWIDSQRARYQRERDGSLAALRATESEKSARLHEVARDRELVAGWRERVGSDQ